jgi:DNA-binding beta-propeller fold protein YncE
MQQQQPVFSRSAFPLLFQGKGRLLSVLLLSFSITLLLVARQRQEPAPYATASAVQHYEYVFPDGNLYVYDMDHGHQLVKHVSLPTSTGVRGVVGNAATHTLYISYGSDGDNGGSLLAYDLLTDKVLWQKTYSHGIDSMAITPDGKTLYMPDGETSSAPYWYVINATDGSESGVKINGGPGPHNTVVSLNGAHVYMGARNFADRPTYLTVADTATNANVRRIGPFQSGVRPFTINRSETLAYVTTTGFLGFQVADIPSGKILFTVDLTQLGFPNTPTGPSAPSHGIALSPDEKTLAVIDWPNNYVHLFNVSGVPSSAPKKTADIKFSRSMHHNEAGCAYDCTADGWLEYSRDGRFLYVGDVGDVIDTTANKVVTNIDTLYNTRKMLEVDFQSGSVVFVPNNRASVGY